MSSSSLPANESSVVVRFAPSPTGYLHIGGARTALFNWLYARHAGGKFLVRIEDTDRERSTQQAIDAIFESLQWLGLDWDNEPVFQFARAPRHAEVAHQLVKEGKAYYCYCSAEELEKMREEALAKKLPPRYNGYWRDRDPREAPEGVAPVVRFKAPQTGKTILDDLVQGPVELDNAQLDDMILLRADGTPTYMLSVVVDDHDMEVTHVIRGDDHLTNMFRQYHLYKACGWEAPTFAHIPLIHGPDGAKLSKRHGALGAEQYKAMGFLPEAMRNYLLRLGWAHGNDEIISTEKAIRWFDIRQVGRSPARFDLVKLTNLNGHYIRQADNDRLLRDIEPLLREKFGTAVDAVGLARVRAGMDGLKERAKTLVELADSAKFYLQKPTFGTDPKQRPATEEGRLEAIVVLDDLKALLRTITPFDSDSIDAAIRAHCKDKGVGLGALMKPIRMALTGTTVSPSLFDVIAIFGLQETCLRLETYRMFLCREESSSLDEKLNS